MSSQPKTPTKLYPLLPLRDVIIFPHMVVPLFVGREKSILALEESSKYNNELFLVTQTDASVLNPEPSDLHQVGVIVSIIQMLRLPDNTVKVLIEGKSRARIDQLKVTDKGYMAEVVPMLDEVNAPMELEAVIRSVKSVFEQYVKMNKRVPAELLMSISAINDGSRLADVIVAHLSMKMNQKQEILACAAVEERLQLILSKMQSEIEIINVEKRIRSRVKSQMEKSQKEYYLNEQMNAIQKELGNRDDGKSDLQEMEDKLAKKLMPKEAKDKVAKELRRLKSMSAMSAESSVVRNYIDWMLALPWQEMTQDDHELSRAQEVLEKEHYGLGDVKERILEYLAVRSLNQDHSKGTILCLAGPPGVGKTSIAKSLASALNRKFVRISLGGVRDEAEIRGHRRTYVGAMPGKIIQALKKAQSSNPVILLDEIDKMSSDFRGDPSSAMLEVLDPEQNVNFSDHYIEVEYDLSKVMFVMTANDLSLIPGPLRDRMELISIAGYTPQEKLQIAKNYLIDKAKVQNGLKDLSLAFNDHTLMHVIRHYTREAGVRELERLMNTIMRKLATATVQKKLSPTRTVNLSLKQIEKLLGPAKFDRTEVAPTNKEIGLVNGLAWTATGGDVLHVEVITVPGNGKLEVTGKLGEVMQESARIALSYVRSLSSRLGISTEWFTKNDIHLHVPEGATPKDGPSAGITIAVALTSAITGISVHQHVAMTGEVTLRGRVLPIGGLKEKILAAKLAGITTVIIPQKNAKDLLKIPAEIKDHMDIKPVSSCEEVLRLALDLSRPESFMNVVNGATPVSGPQLTVIDGDGDQKTPVAN